MNNSYKNYKLTPEDFINWPADFKPRCEKTLFEEVMAELKILDNAQP
jgi:hypothetical protein